MHQSHIIEVAGEFAGAAIHRGADYQFVAVHPRTVDLNNRSWSSLAEMRRAVQRVVLTRPSAQPPANDERA